MREWAASGSFHGLRTRALMLTVWGSALRVSEALALEVGQVLQGPPTAKQIPPIRGTAYLRADQSKKKMGEGSFVITKHAREALRPYLIEGIKRGWIPTDDPKSPLFITAKGGGHNGLKIRAAQYSWKEAQQRAGILEPYRFHDLRHDALTRVAHKSNGNTFIVMQFGRLRDMSNATRYVHVDMLRLTDLAELADA